MIPVTNAAVNRTIEVIHEYETPYSSTVCGNDLYDPIHRQKLFNMFVLGGLQIGYLAEIDSMPFMKDHNLLSHPAHQVEVMGDHDGGEFELGLKTEHEGGQVVAHDGV